MHISLSTCFSEASLPLCIYIYACMHVFLSLSLSLYKYIYPYLYMIYYINQYMHMSHDVAIAIAGLSFKRTCKLSTKHTHRGSTTPQTNICSKVVVLASSFGVRCLGANRLLENLMPKQCLGALMETLVFACNPDL